MKRYSHKNGSIYDSKTGLAVAMICGCTSHGLELQISQIAVDGLNAGCGNNREMGDEQN